MLVTAHSMAAMTLTVTTGSPFVYLPAAVFNHPLLDAIPHFGVQKGKNEKLRWKIFPYQMALDVIMGTTLFFLVLKKTGLPFWLLFLVCLLASWPDLFTLYQRKIDPKLAPKFLKLHENIQHESPWFFWVDLSVIFVCSWIIFY